MKIKSATFRFRKPLLYPFELREHEPVFLSALLDSQRTLGNRSSTSANICRPETQPQWKTRELYRRQLPGETLIEPASNSKRKAPDYSSEPTAAPGSFLAAWLPRTRAGCAFGLVQLV